MLEVSFGADGSGASPEERRPVRYDLQGIFGREPDRLKTYRTRIRKSFAVQTPVWGCSPALRASAYR